MTQTLEKKLLNTVRRAVAESVHDALSDPDYGLELTTAVRLRLAQYRRQKTRCLTPLAEAKRRFS